MSKLILFKNKKRNSNVNNSKIPNPLVQITTLFSAMFKKRAFEKKGLEIVIRKTTISTLSNQFLAKIGADSPKSLEALESFFENNHFKIFASNLEIELTTPDSSQKYPNLILWLKEYKNIQKIESTQNKMSKTYQYLIQAFVVYQMILNARDKNLEIMEEISLLLVNIVL